MRPVHSDSRRAYKRADDQWVEISFSDIRAGDFVLLKEPDGEVVGTFKALSDAYPGESGTYQFKCEIIENKTEE